DNASVPARHLQTRSVARPRVPAVSGSNGPDSHPRRPLPRRSVMLHAPILNDSRTHPSAPPASLPSPSVHGSNGPPGRDSRGRFTRGNPGGPGNPHARRTAALKNAFLAEVTEEDLRAVTRRVIEQAREGDLAAARLL